MSTQKETVAFILEKLGDGERFSARAMFGEYALYADGRVVGLICDDQLYVKICPASQKLETLCEKDAPYPGAKLHFVVTEDVLSQQRDLPLILHRIARSLPAPRAKKKVPISRRPRKTA
jgi:TfoX/Sxy family transcriptional regulator of competence genes